ncbi:hypothetical protein Tco_0786001 [Tanacetum coccineum]
MDALALTPCYSAFLTTTDVPEVYMHQFWDSIHKYDNFLQICPRVHGQKFDEPPTDEVIVSFFKELAHTRDIKSITDVVVDQMHQPWITFATIINRILFGKTSGLDKLCLSTAQILWGIPEMRETKAYKTYLGYATGVTPPKELHLLRRHEITKIPPSAAKIKSSVTNEGTGAKPGEGSDQESESGDDNTQSDKEKGLDSEHETDENETGSESDQEENKEEVKDDEEEKEDESVKTPSNYTCTDDKDETNVESKLNKLKTGDHTTNQVIADARLHFYLLAKRLKFPVTIFSHSSDLASKFLIFLDIPHTVAEIVSPIDVHVHHEVLRNQTPTLLTLPVSVIIESLPIYTTVIPQSLPSFTPLPPQSTQIPPPTTEATNPLSALLNFAFDFQFNNRVSALEKEVAKLKKDDLLNTQVTVLVDEHLDSRIRATKDEFISYLSASITARIIEQSLEHAVLAKESSQPQSIYEAAASLTEFELKKILIDKIDEMYSLKRSRKYKDKDEDPSAGSDRWLKKRKTSKDAEPTKGPKTKEPKSGSSKGTKSQSKSSRKSVHAEEPEFEVTYSDIPQDQEENMGNDDEEPKRKTLQQGPTQSWLMTLAVTADKPSKTFDELMSTPIDFSVYIMNGLKITNLIQETLLRPAFKLLKGTRTNFAELEYDFEECYKALSEKLDWDNPKSNDYPFDLTKHLPLVVNGNRQIVPVDYFFNNNLKYARGLESSHDVYSTKHILAVTRVEVMRKHGYRYLREIEVQRSDNELHTFKEGDFLQLRINDIEDMLILKHGYLKESRRSSGVESYQKKINVTKLETTRTDIRKRDPYTPYQDPQGFIYVDNKGRNKLMRLDELYKFSDGTLTRLRTLLDDITKNI